jgi:hypothetical protein
MRGEYSRGGLTSLLYLPHLAGKKRKTSLGSAAIVLAVALMGLAGAVPAPAGVDADGKSNASGPAARIEAGSADLLVGQHSTIGLNVRGVGGLGLAVWTIEIAVDPDVGYIVACDAYQHSEYVSCNPGFGEASARVQGAFLDGLLGDFSLATITLGCRAGGSSAISPIVTTFADATPAGPLDIKVETVAGALTCQKFGGGPGDANCDERINSADANLVLQISAHLVDSLPCLVNVDVDANGLINVIDASLILQYDAGFLTHLPP